VVGQTVEACILGVLCTFGMLVFGFPYAWMIGTFIGVTALIPVAGCYIGAAVGALMIASVSPLKALWFLVFISVLQQLEGNFIYPRVVGYSLGLGGIWVLGAVTVGGAMFGIPGIMVSVPIVSTMHRLIVEDLIETSLSDDELREWEEASGVKPMKPEAGDDGNYPLLEDMMLKNEPIRKKGIFRRRRKHAEEQDGEPVQREAEQDSSQ
jgi:predicted PurR-regulated permease PerM